jgi:phage replication O-like protein O
MPSPQVENGHTDIANELAEAFARLQLSGNQWRVLWVVIRKTYGWKKKEDRISLTQFEESTGLMRRHVHRALEELAERGIVTKNGYNSVTKIGNRYAITYGLQKDYSLWKQAEKREQSVPKIGNGSVPKIGTYKRKERKGAPPKNEKIENPLVFKISVPVPDPFPPLTPEMKNYATLKGYTGNLASMTEAFVLHHQKKGDKFKSWLAAWQLWLRRELEYHPERKAAVREYINLPGGSDE